MDRTIASQYLLEIATRNAQTYTALPTIRAIILTGSAAEGKSDLYSDIDMIIYYDTLPSEEAFLAAYQQNKGKNRKVLGKADEEYMETYEVQGVECQVAHTTIAAWERDMATVLEQLHVDTPLQKALSGMLNALPLYGETLVQDWQKTLSNYPHQLAQAMVEHYLAIVPVWGIYQRMESRDATIWLYQLLVEASYNILGMLAGLNHLYYSPFQFKRMRHFISQMHIAPPNLAPRIEKLFHSDVASAAQEVERLVQETLELVAQHMPEVDIEPLRKRIGLRQQAWKL